jgi:hypothetical protein
MSGFCRLPGGGQRVVQRAALFVGEIIAFIVGDKLNDGAIGQRGWLVKNKTAFHYLRS